MSAHNRNAAVFRPDFFSPLLEFLQHWQGAESAVVKTYMTPTLSPFAADKFVSLRHVLVL